MIAGYKLKINGGAYSDYVIDVGNVLTYEVTGLLYGVEYGFQVAAYNEEGVDSLYTATVYATPLAPTMLLDIGGNAIVDDEGNAVITFA